MKFRLLFTCFVLSAPALFAQQLVLRGGIGAANTSNPIIADIHTQTGTSFSPSLCGKLGVGVSFPFGWELGFDALVTRASDKGYDYTYIYGNPLVNISIYTNRRIIAGVYIGINAGAGMASVSKSTAIRHGNMDELKQKLKTGFTVGGLAGYDLRLSRHMSLNAEAGLKRVMTSLDGPRVYGCGSSAPGTSYSLSTSQRFTYLLYYVVTGVKFEL